MIRKIAEKFTVLALGLFALAASAPHAYSENWVRYQDYKINLEVPAGWTVERDLYGMPLTVLGPERDGERAVMNIQHTPLEKVDFNLPMIAATQSQYFKGRKEWLDELDGTRFISEIPFEALSRSAKVKGFQLGFRYEMRGLEFEERSVQIVCNERMFFVKTLYSSKEPTADKQVLADLVQKLNCSGVTAKDGAYQPSNLQDFAKKYEAQYGERWPNHEQVKSASLETKAVMLESVVEFYKRFEAAAGDDLYSANQKKFRSLLNEAFADGEGFDCFFGGWPSKFVKSNGRLTCASPADTNSDYAAAGKSCGENQMACNPALFGKNVCISIASPAERSRATLRCEAGFKKAGKTYEEIVKDKGFNLGLFEQTIQSAEAVCSQEDYATGNYGLCSTLKEKLNLSISSGHKQAGDEDKQFIQLLDSVKPSNYDKTVKATLANYAEFEKRCFDSKNNFLPDVNPNMDEAAKNQCLEDLKNITDDMNRVEDLHKQVGKEIQKQEDAVPNSKGALKNKDCSSGNCGAGEPVGASAAAALEQPDNSCSKAELARVKAEPCTWNTWLTASGAAGVALVKSLFNTVEFVGDMVKGAWNWLTGTSKIENKTSTKAHQASKTSNSFLTQLKKDPMGTITNLFSAIFTGIKEFVKNDVFCAKWSDMSFANWKQAGRTCLIPGNFDCMSCKTIANGIGSSIGYVVGEFVPGLLTGSIGVASAAKIAEFMKAGKTAGKFAKLSAELAAKFPKIAKAGERALEISKNTAKYVRESKVVQVTGKVASKTKTAFKVSSDAIKSFRSKFGDFGRSLSNMEHLRDLHWSKRAGIYVARIPARVAVGVVNGTANLITAPVRLPTKYLIKPMVKGQQAAFEYGLKYSSKLADISSLSASTISKARTVGVALPYVKYGMGLNQNIKTAHAIEEKQIGGAEAWKKILPKVTSGKNLDEKELKVFAEANQMSVDAARLELIDGKMTLLQQGNRVSLSDAEIKLWSKNEAAKDGSDPAAIEQALHGAMKSMNLTPAN